MAAKRNRPSRMGPGRENLPTICRYTAGAYLYGRSCGQGERAMVGLGRKEPNGKKIFELRRKIGLKQEVLAVEVGVSVRTLRDIERKDHAIHSATITAIATQLKVSPEQITLSTPEDSQQHHMLKLKPFRSAHQLSCLAEEAHQFNWGFNLKGKTAKETQQLVGIV